MQVRESIGSGSIHTFGARRSARRKSALLLASAFSVAAGLLGTSDARAATDSSWILGTSGTTSPTDVSGDGGTGFFDVAGNWSGSAVPSGNRAVINNGGTAIIQNGDSISLLDLATGAYNASGGTAPTPLTGGYGSYQMTGGTLTINNLSNYGLELDDGGTGTTSSFTLSGGLVSMANANSSTTFMSIGASTGATGILNISGGTFNQSSKGYADIGGNGGIGIFNLSGGTYNSTASDLNIDDAASGSGTLNVTGGTLNLGGKFVYIGKFAGGTGTVNLSAGTIITGSVYGKVYSSPPANGTSIFNFSGGTLQAGAATASPYGFMSNIGTVNDISGANFNTGNFQPYLYQNISHAGTATIDGGMNVSGGNFMYLLGTSTFNGAVTLNSTAVKVAFDGTSAGAASPLGVVPSTLIQNDIVLNNGQIINYVNTTLLNINANRGITIVGNGYFEPGYGNGKAALQGGTALTVNSPITGNGNLGVVFDAGVLVLAGSDSYTGSTIVGSTGANNNTNTYYNNAASSVGLRIANANAIPGGSPLVFNQHPNQAAVTESLDLNAFTPSFGGVSTANSSTHGVITNTNSSSATLTMGQGTTSSSSFTYNGIVSQFNSTTGAVSVTQNGPDTQFLTGANTYQGSTSVLSGKLYVNGTIGSATGTTLSISGGATFGGGATVLSSATVAAGGTIESGIAGATALNLSNGLMFTGNGNITIGNLTANGSNALNVSGGLLDPGGHTVTINVSSATSGVTLNGVYPLIDYSISGLGSNAFAGFSLGTLPLRATGMLINNTTTDQIEVQITGTDYLLYTGNASSGMSSAPWDTTTVNWKTAGGNSATAYIDSPGDSVVFDDTATGPTNITVASTLHPNAVTFNNNTLNYNFSGAGGIAGVSAVTLNGTATVTMGLSNSYTGSTTINNGTLIAGSNNALSPASALAIGNTATAAVSTNGFNIAVGSLNGGGSNGGTVNLSGGSLTTGALNGTDTFAGTFIGTGGLTETGTGSLTLTGSNTYTGTTTVNTGATLNVGSMNDTGASNIGYGPLVLNGVLVYNSNAQSSTGRTITSTSGAALFNVSNAAGTLVLTGAANISGGGIAKYGLGTLVIDGPLKDTDTGHGFYADAGTVIVGTGGSITTSAYSTIAQGAGQTGTLVLLGTGTFTDGGDLNICDGSPSLGTVNISGTALLQGVNVYVGKGGSDTGIVNMTGGTLNSTATGDALRIGGGTGTGDVSAVGIVSVSGGTINTTNAGALQTGYYGQGELNISGTAAVNISGYAVTGRYLNSSGTVDVSGNGQYNQSSASYYMIIGEQGTGIVTVRGNASVTAVGGTRLGGAEANALGTATLTLDGGTMTTKYITMPLGSDIATLNFNGGTLKANANTTSLIGANSAVAGSLNLTNAYVYSGGANIDAAGFNVAIPQPLVAPPDQGVTSITVTNGGSGYVTAPIVSISGVGNYNTTGATAVAQVSNGVITNIIVTNPGATYGSPPTVTINPGISGGAGATFQANLGNVSSSGPVTISSSVAGGVVTLSGANSYGGPTNVSSGTLIIAADQALPSGTLANGMPASNIANVAASATLVLPDQTAASNLTNLNMNGYAIVHGGSLAAITAAAASGYASGAWNGPTGVTSTAAASDPTHLHAVGVILNDNGSGVPLYGTGGTLGLTFGNNSPVDGDVLVKYTYYGDANLDGQVDGSDYSRIDAAFSQEQTTGIAVSGWANGDFNYDGVVDGSDYTLIDNAFNSQGAQVLSQFACAQAQPTAQISGISGSASVPEPATLSTVGLAATALLMRRRNRSR